MHEHDDVERVLARYRPSGPPARLRARVIGATPPARSRVRVWLPAAALAAAIVLHLLASRTHAALEASTAGHVAASLAEIDDTAAALGGEYARRAARLAEERWIR